MSSERTGVTTSVLGPDVVVIGNISGKGDLEIRGRLQGNLRLEGRFLLAKGGTIVGNVEASSVAIEGTVQGDIEARDGIEIQGAGSVEGNMVAPRIGIETGAQVRGMLTTVSQGAKSPGAKKPEARIAPLDRSATQGARSVEPLVAAEVPEAALLMNGIESDSDNVDSEFDDDDGELDDGGAVAGESEAGPQKARRKRRRRRKRPENSAGQAPQAWSEEETPAREHPAPAPTPSPDGPPRPATFQKGAQAQRRRS